MPGLRWHGCCLPPRGTTWQDPSQASFLLFFLGLHSWLGSPGAKKNDPPPLLTWYPSAPSSSPNWAVVPLPGPAPLPSGQVQFRKQPLEHLDVLPAQTNGAPIHGPDPGPCWVGQQLLIFWKVMEACGFAFSHLFLEHKYLSKALQSAPTGQGRANSLSMSISPKSVCDLSWEQCLKKFAFIRVLFSKSVLGIPTWDGYTYLEPAMARTDVGTQPRGATEGPISQVLRLSDLWLVVLWKWTWPLGTLRHLPHILLRLVFPATPSEI